jgi:hypothetical protein
MPNPRENTGPSDRARTKSDRKQQTPSLLCRRRR